MVNGEQGQRRYCRQRQPDILWRWTGSESNEPPQDYKRCAHQITGKIIKPGVVLENVPWAAATGETDGKTPATITPSAVHALTPPDASGPASAWPAGELEAATRARDAATHGMARAEPSDAAAAALPAPRQAKLLPWRRGLPGRAASP